MNGRKTEKMNKIDQKTVYTIKALCADMIQKANSGHPGLPLGAAGFTHVLWSQVLNHDAKHPEWINRDRFILSAGHGSSMLYSSCATLSRAFWISSLILRAFLWSRPLAVIPTTSPSSI